MIASLRPPVAPDWVDVLADATRWAPHLDVSTIVVVPHPDDEAVMFGGLLARLAHGGADVRLIAVTDGGAAYPDLVPCHVLEQLRRDEQRDALDAIGIRRDAVTRLGVPDGEVSVHERLVTDAILQADDERRIGMIVAPWEFDHHTDHEACGRAALVAARHIEGRPVLASGLFWSMLRDRPRVGIGLRAVSLDASERSAKAHAIGCHRSQVAKIVTRRPVLTSAELAVARWPREHYVVRDV